jgi:hypothetical protein
VTIKGTSDNWTVEKAIQTVREFEEYNLKYFLSDPLLDKDSASGMGEFIYNDEEFTHFYSVWSQTLSGPGPFRKKVLHTTTMRYADIERVRVKVQLGYLLTLGVIAPWNAEGPARMEMKDGRSFVAGSIDYPGLVLFPCWLYPYHLIHGYSKSGEAFDFLRRHSASPYEGKP